MSQNPYSRWTFAEKILFRFVFLLLILFILFFNNGIFPVLNIIAGEPSQKIVMWLANGVLGLNYIPPMGRGGSGDTTHHYILLLFVSLVSVAGCLVWSLFDRARKSYEQLFYWLSVIVRFYVGIMLIHYGIAKIIKTQFMSPDLTRLLSTYGDSSPMGLAWTFLGFSDGYNLFMGIAEVMCGLLLFRKMATLGAIIALMVSANIMAINYFFDVPVKIVSTALVVMSLFLLIPNMKRLIDLFIKGKAVSLRVIEPPVLKKKWLYYSKITFKYVLIAYCVLPTVFFNLKRREHYGDAAPKLPLYGAYIVDSFESELPVAKWETLITQRSTFSAIKMNNNEIEHCNITVDTAKHQLNIVFKDDLNTTHKFNYRVFDSEYLELKGIYFEKTLNVKLKRQHFELTERPFNWISDEPYNR